MIVEFKKERKIRNKIDDPSLILAKIMPIGIKCS
jgi:hypothetical protein